MDDEPAARSAPREPQSWSCANVGCVLLVVAFVVGLVVLWVSFDLMCNQDCEENNDAGVSGVLAMIYGGLAFIATPLIGGLVLLLIKGRYGYGRRQR